MVSIVMGVWLVLGNRRSGWRIRGCRLCPIRACGAGQGKRPDVAEQFARTQPWNLSPHVTRKTSFAQPGDFVHLPNVVPASPSAPHHLLKKKTQTATYES